MLKTKFIILILVKLFLSEIAEAGRVNLPGIGKCLGKRSYDPNKVWNRLTVNGIEYQIRNIPKKQFPAAKSLAKQYLKDETQVSGMPFYIKIVCYILIYYLSIGETVTDRFVQKTQQRWESHLSKNLSIACYDNNNKIVGVAILNIAKSDTSKSKRGEPSVIKKH